MLVRNTKSHSFPTKNQEMQITLRDGRVYTIVSPDQMNYLIEMQVRQKNYDLSAEKAKMTEEEVRTVIEAHVAAFLAACPFASLDYVHSQMSKEDVEQWKVNYRFCGITRKSAQ